MNELLYLGTYTILTEWYRYLNIVKICKNLRLFTKLAKILLVWTSWLQLIIRLLHIISKIHRDDKVF